MSAPSVNDALILLVGIKLGYVDHERIIAWADDEIAAASKPGDALVELSLSRRDSVHDVISLLRRLAIGAGTRLEAELTLALLHRMRQTKRTNLCEATQIVASLIHTGLLTEIEEAAAYHFDDGYQLALNGSYGTLEELAQELNEFTEPFWAAHQENLARFLDSAS